MAASLRISLNNMENGDISSGVLSSKERDLKRQMEKLHRCYMKKKEWKDSMRVVQQSMSREKKMLMETDKEPGSLRSCLDRLQSCIKVVSQQTLLERLETTSRLVDLSFTPPTGTENSAIISSEMFRIEIIFDPGGLVKDVRISHQGEPTSCDEITEVLRQGNFDEFIVHLKGLQSIYNISGDRKQKSKAYLALQALETDLNSLAQLQSSIKGVSNCIHKSPLGILLPRKGGCPMKLVYFVSPYDLLNKRTRSPHPMTVEAITEHGLGQSVTVCIEPHSYRRLQTIPLMSVVPQDGKSLPSFQALSQVNSTSLPACFTLMLARPIPVAMSVIHAIQEVTDIDVITEGEPESLLKLILAQSSGGKLSPGSEFFVTLPDQQHAYYLRDIGESSLDQTAKMVSRIPFTHPTNVANILNLLRQQLLFNTVISSCIRPYAKQDLMSSVVFELVCTSLQQFTIMFEHPLQDTMVTAEVDLTDITGVKFKVSIGEDGEDLLSDDAASKIFQRCWSVPVTLRSIIHKVSEQLRKEPSPEPVAMEIEQPPFVMPQEVTFATPYLPAMDSKSISSPGNMVLPNAKIPQGYGGIPPNTTQGAMLPPPIVEDSKKLDDDVPSSNPLLVTLLDQDSPDPDPPSVPESPMLSRLLEDSPSNNNTNSSLNNNNNVANLASSVPAPLKPGRGRPPKRKSVTDPPKGKSPKHRLTDNEYQSQSLSFESLTSSFDSDFQNASLDSQRFPHFSLSSPIDLTDDSVNPLRRLENTLDSIQSKQSMHHSSDPLADLTSELDSIQDVSIFSQTNSVPKNMARSTSLEGILNRSGEVSRTKDLHKPHHLQDSVPSNQARKTLVRQNSVGKVAQYQHQISIDSNDSFKAGSNLSFSRSTSFTHGNTSDSDTSDRTSLYSTRSFDLSDSFNNLSPVSNSSISRHDIGGDLTTEFKPELKLGHKDLRSLLMSSPNENSLLQSEKLKLKNTKGKMRMKLSGIKNSDLLGINRKKSSAEAYDFNSDEEDSNDLSMITASPTGLQLFNKSKTAKHLLNKIGKGDKLKKKEAKSTEPGKRKRDKKEKEHKKKKRLDSNSRATSCEMYSATPVESEDKTSTKLKIIKSVGVSMENSPRSSPSGREKGDGTRKSSINSQKSLKNSHKSLSMTSVNVSKEDSKLMTKTPKIKLKPIAIPPSSAVSNAKTPTPTSSPGSATPTSTTIGRIGAVSILTSGNSKAGGTTPSPGKVSTPTSAKTPPTFGGSKSFPSNKSVASSSTSLKAASAERKLSQSGRLSSGISKSSNGKYSSDRKSGSPSVLGSKSGLNSSKSLNSSSKGQSSNSFSKNSNNPLNSVLSFLNPKDKGLSSLPRIPKISSASSSNNNTKPTVSVTSTSVSTTTSVLTSVAGMSKLTTVNSHSNTKVSVSNNPHQGGVRNSPNTPGTPKNFPANSKNSANLNSKSTLANSPNVRGSQLGSRSPSVNSANNKSPSSSNGKSPLSHTSNKLGINGRPPSNSNPPKTPVGSNTAHPLKTPTPGSGHNNGSPNINKPIPISTPPPTTTINKSNPQTSSPSSYPPKATPIGDQSPSVSNLSRNSPLLSQGPPGKTLNLVTKVSESPKSISVTTASKVTSPIMVSTDTPPKTTTPGSMVSPTTSCPSSNAKMRPRKSSLSAVIDKLTNAKVPHGVGGETNRQNSLDEGGEQAKAKTENALDGLDKASNGLERQSVSEPKKADSSDKNVPSKDSPSGIDKNKDLKIVDNSRNLFASLLKSASENFTSKHDKDDKENVSKSETGGKPWDSSEDVDSKAKDLSMQSVCKKSPKVIPKVNGETNVTVDNSIRKGEGDVFKVPTPKSGVSVDENDCEDIENMSVRRKARISTTKPVLSPASSGGSPENLIIDCQSPRQHGKNNSLNSPKCIVDLNDENKKLSPVTVVNNRQKTHTPSPKPKHSPNPSPKSVQHSSPAGMLEIDDDLMNEAIMGFTS